MKRRTVIQFIILLASFVTLIFLGTWQIQRLEWKNEIINKLNAEYAKNPSDNIFTFQELQQIPEDELDIRYGNIKGEFIYDKEILMGPHAHKKEISYKVITPMKLTNNNYIFVQRGWLKQTDKDKLTEAQNRPKGIISLTAIFRTPEWNSFTPNNSPENNIWMKLDIDEIAQAKEIQSIAPVIAYTEKSSKDFGLIQIETTKQYPRNNHKQYALFWYGMALILFIIAGIYGVQTRRSKT